MVALDAIDQKILQIIQDDGRITNAELARQVALSPPAVHARLRRLEEAGLIQRYTALLNREALGYDLLCLINISMERHRRSDIDLVRKAVLQMNEVLECHHVTGEFDYQLDRKSVV